MKRVRIALVALIASTFMMSAPVIPALAQDSAPVAPVVAVTDNTPPEWTGFLAGLAGLLNEVTYLAPLAPGVVVIVSALKAIAAIFKKEVNGTRAVLLSLAIQVIVWIVYQFSVKGGFDLQFQQWYDVAINVIQALFPLAVIVGSSHYVYTKTRSVPVLGYGGYRKPEG